jgi:hypothetical protein
MAMYLIYRKDDHRVIGCQINGRATEDGVDLKSKDFFSNKDEIDLHEVIKIPTSTFRTIHPEALEVISNYSEVSDEEGNTVLVVDPVEVVCSVHRDKTLHHLRLERFQVYTRINSYDDFLNSYTYDPLIENLCKADHKRLEELDEEIHRTHNKGPLDFIDSVPRVLRERQGQTINVS